MGKVCSDENRLLDEPEGLAISLDRNEPDQIKGLLVGSNGFSFVLFPLMDWALYIGLRREIMERKQKIT